MSGANDRPITDELVCLKQAVDLLNIAEDLAQPENIEHYPGAIASVIRSARTLVKRSPRTSPRKAVLHDGRGGCRAHSRGSQRASEGISGTRVHSMRGGVRQRV
jgi:hypothetical protein